MAESIHFIKKRVLVLYTGGTIGMRPNDQNVLAPLPLALIEFLNKQIDMHDPQMAEKCFGPLQHNQLVLPAIDNFAILYEIIEYDPLLDSSNMKPSNWIYIASDIGRYYDNFDGFVIIHGTDTMSYTASALSFMLEGLHKSIILTGGLVPIFELRTDSKENLLLSIILAACYNIPEVCILFAFKLLRGNRSIKCSSASFEGFATFNYHNLADIGMTINVHQNYVRKPDEVPFKVVTNISSNIAVLKLTPTVTPVTMEAVVKSNVDGIVLQTYGTGSMRDTDEYRKILQWAVDRGLIIVITTQCRNGSVTFTYQSWQWLADIGIANGKDMTCEAAIAKLCYILPQKNLSRKEKIEMIETDLRGEMTT